MTGGGAGEGSVPHKSWVWVVQKGQNLRRSLRDLGSASMHKDSPDSVIVKVTVCVCEGGVDVASSQIRASTPLPF